MDWQTKEYIDSKFENIEDSLDLIMDKLGIVESDEDLDDVEAIKEVIEEKKLDF